MANIQLIPPRTLDSRDYQNHISSVYSRAASVDDILIKAADNQAISGQEWLSLARSLLPSESDFGGSTAGGICEDAALFPLVWRRFFSSTKASVTFHDPEDQVRYRPKSLQLSAVYYYSRSTLVALVHEMAHLIEATISQLGLEDFGLDVNEDPLIQLSREAKTVLWQRELLLDLSLEAKATGETEALRHMAYWATNEALFEEYLYSQRVLSLACQAGLNRKGKSLRDRLWELFEKEAKHLRPSIKQFEERWFCRVR
jgi:hypothetical protein